MSEMHPSYKFADASLRVARRWLKELAHWASDSRQQKRRRAFATAFAKVTKEYAISRIARRKMARNIARREWRSA